MIHRFVIIIKNRSVVFPNGEIVSHFFLQDFSFCGDRLVEGEEECDCGLHYDTCGDPCCYPAQIHADDLAENRSAVPCR